MDTNVKLLDRFRWPLRSSGIFKGLKDAELVSILRNCRPQEAAFNEDDILWTQDDPFVDLFILRSGRLICYRNTISCKDQLVCYYDPGQPIALEGVLSHKHTSPFTIKSSMEGSYVSLSFKQILKSDKLHRDVRETILLNLAKVVADDSIRNMNKACVLARYKSQDRIIAFLELVGSRSKGDFFDVGMDRQEMANYLSVDRTTLSTELNKLQRAGTIEMQGRNFRLL
ncbi:MAG: Crp/Fnr family transcriptional regulator [Coriobacteriales bacterium]|jgi:CRP-like cAMP-binding protein|nr:Crp/Fnr family transcriptional regulator [Coriobacteriales bacterium]